MSSYDYDGDIQTARDTGGISQFEGGRINARVKVTAEQITLAGTETAGSVIALGGQLLAGATILKIELYATAAQTSLTFKLGDGASDDRYLAAGATGLQTANSVVTIPGDHYVIGTNASDNQLILTTAGATATAGELYCDIYFTTD